MPAISLGLAEIDERLRILRWRLNAVLLQHWLYLSASAVVLMVAVLVVLGIRVPAATFRIATWAALAVSLSVAAGCGLILWRRWLDTQATAHLADRRAQLSDRLATLADLRRRPRAARLAPVLVAQALALGAHWHPRQVAPRRVPRSLLLLLGSLLFLAATVFIARRAPAPQMMASASHPPSAMPQPPSPAPRTQRSSREAQAGSDQALRPSQQSTDTADTDGTLLSGGQPAAGGERSADKTGLDAALVSLPDKLQGAIRRALHAEALDKPHSLSASAGEREGETGGDADGATGDATQQRNIAAGGKPGTEKAPAPGEAGKPAPAEAGAPQRSTGQGRESAAPDQPRAGSAPAAGSGSSPEGLMDPNAAGLTAGTDGPKTFKLTITSFLRAMEQKGSPPRQGGKRVSGSSSPRTGNRESTALSDRQLNDDVLRKAEIPAEYEEIVRRVYSARSQP